MSDEIKQEDETASTLTTEQSVEEIAATILTNQALSTTNENVIVNNFVKFFEPIIKSLDSNVESLRLSQCDLTNQIKNLLNRNFCLL